MMEELFICEKPSQAQIFGEALSGQVTRKNGFYEGKDGRVYAYAFGHLVTCKSPEELNEKWGWKGEIEELPFFKRHIPLKLINDDGIKKQFGILCTLMKEAETIYEATDAGREGEHIFRKIYELSGITGKVKRLWVQNMTAGGIEKAYNNAKDAREYDSLAVAGRLREEADMMVGMNATMLLTKLAGNHALLSLGRVQTPTLAMIIKRDEDIKSFKSVKHYTLAAKTKNGHTFELLLGQDVRLTKKDAETLFSKMGSRVNFCVNSKEVIEKPKHLFNLTTLQMYMNEKKGWSAQKTLDVIQKIYEKKLVSYPRTSSEYLASDDSLPDLLKAHRDDDRVKVILDNDYTFEKSFVNPNKVSDHEGLTPTTSTAKNLTDDEKLLYETIFKRFVAAFYPKALYIETTSTFEDANQIFRAKEKVLKKAGWRSLYETTFNPETLKDVQLEDIGPYELVEKNTQPPKAYTEQTLLRDMQDAAKFLDNDEDKKLLKNKEVEGIGTPATRANIIETLLKRHFIERKGKKLISTDLGSTVIHMMPESFSLYSPKLTAYFESLLIGIEENSVNEDFFYKKLKVLVEGQAQEIRLNHKEIKAPSKEVIAKCPTCGRPMFENKKSYYCSGYKEGCRTQLWKNGLSKLGKKNITKREAGQLLKGVKIKVKLKSKSGNAYEGTVCFNKEKNWVELMKK